MEVANKEKKHIRHPFTKIEDIMLARLVKEYGCSNWKLIASKIPGRNSRQCRDRWCFFLAPDLNKGSFSFEEDIAIISLYNKYGSDWKRISKFFYGRSHISIRNRALRLMRKFDKFNPECLNKIQTLDETSEDKLPPMNEDPFAEDPIFEQDPFPVFDSDEF